jgi:hypothetical protein
MTNEQINAAIAKAAGWKGCPECNDPICEDNFIPNYCADLNAMHEVENVFNYEQCENFSNNVADIVHAANREKDYRFPWHFARIHATARQRAEAFLRTLGL